MTRLINNHFHVHPLLWILLGIGILTGSLWQLVIMFSLVWIHELGHYAMARFFKWRIRSVMLWPFGGVMETEEHHTRPFHEEVLVVVAGPLQHVWLWGAISLLGYTGWLSPATIEMMHVYNGILFLFNLLPIWPLDGGKLLFLSLSYALPFVRAQQILLYLSVFFLVVSLVSALIFLPFSLSTIFLAAFLLWENRLEWKQREYSFLRYLMKRHEQNGEKVHKLRAIHVNEDIPVMHIFRQFKRGNHHQIFVTRPNQSRAQIDEGECLYYYFTMKQSRAKAAELAEWFAS
ncbi:M50 family metallopeptidase [Pontibacillus sp. ALD_SL1]|uniref:M50 family metallopeptidase n=1 Tax=Pontibacillus sp. ALD_SL1 TaxID=2777185 RepID=UPI001A970E60|nr:M50 family metallopeptidase [Pontibacillus sp. ALD_SL1]QSS99099.1 M50 family metallopeptidase [Pontibacillus sp. ALD_SL1]